MTKFKGKIAVRRTKNELRTNSELKELENEYNNSQSQIILDFGIYIPLRVLILEYEKLGLTEDMIRPCLFYNVKKQPLDLLEENFTKTSIVEEKKAREYLNELLGEFAKRIETKRRKLTRSAQKRKLKEKQFQTQNFSKNEN